MKPDSPDDPRRRMRHSMYHNNSSYTPPSTAGLSNYSVYPRKHSAPDASMSTPHHQYHLPPFPTHLRQPHWQRQSTSSPVTPGSGSLPLATRALSCPHSSPPHPSVYRRKYSNDDVLYSRQTLPSVFSAYIPSPATSNPSSRRSSRTTDATSALCYDDSDLVASLGQRLHYIITRRRSLSSPHQRASQDSVFTIDSANSQSHSNILPSGQSLPTHRKSAPSFPVQLGSYLAELDRCLSTIKTRQVPSDANVTSSTFHLANPPSRPAGPRAMVPSDASGDPKVVTRDQLPEIQESPNVNIGPPVSQPLPHAPPDTTGTLIKPEPLPTIPDELFAALNRDPDDNPVQRSPASLGRTSSLRALRQFSVLPSPFLSESSRYTMAPNGAVLPSHLAPPSPPTTGEAVGGGEPPLSHRRLDRHMFFSLIRKYSTSVNDVSAADNPPSYFDLPVSASNLSLANHSRSQLQQQQTSIHSNDSLSISDGAPSPRKDPSDHALEHQVMLHDVSVGCSHSGWLNKLMVSHSSIFTRKSWKRRHFVLSGSGLYRFKNSMPHSLSGETLSLTPGTIVCVSDAFSSKRWVLEITTPNVGTWFVQADGREDMKQWLSILKGTVARLQNSVNGPAVNPLATEGGVYPLLTPSGDGICDSYFQPSPASSASDNRGVMDQSLEVNGSDEEVIAEELQENPLTPESVHSLLSDNLGSLSVALYPGTNRRASQSSGTSVPLGLSIITPRQSWQNRPLTDDCFATFVNISLAYDHEKSYVSHASTAYPRMSQTSSNYDSGNYYMNALPTPASTSASFSQSLTRDGSSDSHKLSTPPITAAIPNIPQAGVLPGPNAGERPGNPFPTTSTTLPTLREDSTELTR
ncbi:hypothetical protein IWQ61_004154 [Dispira simplex]|nr:hypothetical protein IWQ61_004154 [Dispira simplex]